MQAGRELDTLIAEKVMGWARIPDQHPEIEAAGGMWQTPAGPRMLLPFSADISRAWEVWERISTPQWSLHRTIDGQGYEVLEHVQYEDYNSLASAFTAPLAICLAALRAVGDPAATQTTTTQATEEFARMAAGTETFEERLARVEREEQRQARINLEAQASNQRRRLATLEAALTRLRGAWDALGRCVDEFEPEQPEACAERRDALDQAILDAIRLSAALT
jgi:hypothetical protein